MNWRHLQTFVWLRWRLLYNQWRRAGALNAVLMMIVTVSAVFAIIPLFFGAIALGMYAIPMASPAHLMYAWDGLIVAFIFFWMAGLVAELQRSEPLTLSKFLHLPVSVNGAFLINYVSSLVRLSSLTFPPIMLGFCLALLWTKGPVMMPALAALAAFLLMVTALTYQFQGWLAALMSNPRRRRSVVVVTTVAVVLLAQLPNVFNFIIPKIRQSEAEATRLIADELTKLNADHKIRQPDGGELSQKTELLARRQQQEVAGERAGVGSLAAVERTVRLVNLIIPAGWLPLGVAAAATGRIAPLLFGSLGMALIGTASLYRAYRTTVGMYVGQAGEPKARPALASSLSVPARKQATSLLEVRIPGFSEPVLAVALGTLRSLIRSPEAKMMLLSPLIMIPIFGSMLWNGRQAIPESVRPLIAIGGMVIVLFGLVQLMGNQFGFDRDGFRVFVLCAAARRDILLGKNLAFVPVGLTFALGVLAIVQVVVPMRPDHLLSMVPLFGSMFFLFCIFTNLMSIMTPYHIAAGSLKPSNPNMKTVLLQMVMFFVLFPLTQAPMLLPLGTEAGLRFLGRAQNVPVCLLLSLVELPLAAAFYYFALYWLGDLLQAREQNILRQVIGKGS